MDKQIERWMNLAQDLVKWPAYLFAILNVRFRLQLFS